MVRRTQLLLVLLACGGVVGCATGPFARAPKSPEKAIRACSAEVPADAVPYADVFSECMERRGFVYRGTAGPRQ